MQNQGKLETSQFRSAVEIAVLSLVGCLMFSSVLSSADRISPLKAEANKRYLVDQNNVPFLMQGDAAWSLIVELKEPEVEQYLTNRRQKGFNAIMVNLIEHKFCKLPPLNSAGDGPFTTPGDFSTPNEKYFAYADRVIRKAAENGIYVLLDPIYLGYVGTDDGWIEEALANGPKKCLAYGRYLGRRYKDFDNIIWIMGGDRHPGPALEDVDMIALGIKEYDQRHTFSAHCDPDHSAVDDYSGGRWLDFNTIYTYEIVHARLLQDYNRTPVMPFVLIESSYEGEHNVSEVQIRRQAYWSVLCGGFGHVFGDNPIWHFDTPGFFAQFANGVQPVKRMTWQQAMDLPGSVGMEFWGGLFRSRNWYDLIPDQKHEVVTSGLGEFRGLDYLAAARTSDGSTMIAYMPTSRTIGVEMSKLAGREVKGWWYDPRNGKAREAGKYRASGRREFTPPGEGDWVLVLDDADRQLSAPGDGR